MGGQGYAAKLVATSAAQMTVSCSLHGLMGIMPVPHLAASRDCCCTVAAVAVRAWQEAVAA